MIRFVQAEGKAHMDLTRDLFREYSSFLGIDLGFQDFDKELVELPGEYAPPDGRPLVSCV
jgi:hypothetical protein